VRVRILVRKGLPLREVADALIVRQRAQVVEHLIAGPRSIRDDHHHSGAVIGKHGRDRGGRRTGQGLDPDACAGFRQHSNEAAFTQL
jgi:hypothetical protein